MRLSRSSGEAKTVPRVAADIAQRLLEAGRADEAWSAINGVDEKRPGWVPFEWEQIRVDVMEALGRNVEAQAFRWQCFERTLSISHLRTYLKRLPEFEDLEAEERAISHALKSSSVHQALARIAFRQINKATGNRLCQQLADKEPREPPAPASQSVELVSATLRSAFGRGVTPTAQVRWT